MNLYHWQHSTLLKRYGYGDIIVMAESQEQAIEKALAHFEKWIFKDRGYMYNAERLNDDDREEIEDLRELLVKDLKEIPITPGNVVFVEGSE